MSNSPWVGFYYRPFGDKEFTIHVNSSSQNAENQAGTPPASAKLFVNCFDERLRVPDVDSWLIL
jgi:hypothetical protein